MYHQNRINVIVRMIAITIALILWLVPNPNMRANAATPSLSIPSFPHVKRMSDTSLQVSWNKVNDADGYEVYRYVKASKAYVKMKSIKGFSSMRWIDKRLKKNTRYSYKVRAYRTDSGSKEYSGFTYAVSALTYKKDATTVNAGTKFKGGESMTIGLGQKLQLKATVTPSLLSKAKKKKVIDKSVRVVLPHQNFVQKADGTTIIGKQIGVTNVYALAHNGNVKKISVNVVDYAKPKTWQNLDMIHVPEVAALFTDYYDDFTDMVSWLSQHNEIEGELKLGKDRKLVNASDINLDGIEKTVLSILEQFNSGELIIWVCHEGIQMETWGIGRYTIIFNIQDSYNEDEFNESVYHGLQLADHWAFKLFAGE